MSDVRNCKRCGKVYSYFGGAPICSSCKNDDEDDFKRVKEYLYNNPGCSLGIISNDLDVSVEKIKRFLREGRLEIVEDEGNLILECESCGKSIKTGRLCDSCSKGLSKDLQFTASDMSESITSSQPETKSVGMRYLNKEVKRP